MNEATGTNVRQFPADPTEYAICKRRGHKPGPYSISQGNRTIFNCRWCHVDYWWEEHKELHEMNAPDHDDQGN